MVFDIAESTHTCMYLNAVLAIWAFAVVHVVQDAVLRAWLGGGGLVSAKLIFVSQEVMTAVAPARKGEE